MSLTVNFVLFVCFVVICCGSAGLCAVSLLLNGHLRYEWSGTLAFYEFMSKKGRQMTKQLSGWGVIFGLVFMGQSLAYAAGCEPGQGNVPAILQLLPRSGWQRKTAPLASS